MNSGQQKRTDPQMFPDLLVNSATSFPDVVLGRGIMTDNLMHRCNTCSPLAVNDTNSAL